MGRRNGNTRQRRKTVPNRGAFVGRKTGGRLDVDAVVKRVRQDANGK